MSGSNNILQTICAKRRADIKGLKRKLALESFAVGLKPSNRSLYQALRKPGAAFILECKKASPSKGLIRENFDLEEIIAAYSPYAAAQC